ncbi:gliding motility-associated C-terminal domain-containing protein [Croceitalea marina]|uniref:Gliding motility-associated C-terminal domain-containing protein n=1 Tax=Croceitalea marina TaxID=1775166 RepID=A0ABW5MYU2_9FLAO
MKDVNLCRTLMLTVCIALFTSTIAIGQVLNKPEPAPNANIGATSPWTAACASADFNEYFMNFTWSPPLVDSANEFILELSDASGNFDAPTELDRVSDKNTNFDFDFSFSLATDVQGDGYRFRVRSTSPALMSPESDAFSMYYIGYNNPILISKDGSGNIPPGGVIENCNSGNITLATHNVTTPQNYNYNWYRSGTLLSEKTNSITVTQDGMYFVEIDYGPNCSGSANTLSNTIEIQTGASSGIAIAASSGTTLCAGQTVDLVANIDDPTWTYTWYQDGAAVTSPTLGDSSFTVNSSTANFEGDYTLQIEGSGVCTETTNAITISNAGNFSVSLGNDTNIVLLPGQTRTLSVSSTASSATYQWYKDGSPLAGETNTTLEISAVGVYFARVTENGGACSGNTKDSENTTAVLPASFEFTIDFSSTYTSCESTSAVLALTQINAVATDGTRTDVTADLSADFSYQWLKDGVLVAGETSNTISLASAAENGNYTLEGSLDSFSPNSNERNATLASGETVTISSTDLALCDGINSVTLMADIDLANETFTWTRDGNTVSTTDRSLTTSETGVYELEVQRTGCPVRSNQVTIIQFDESIVTVDADENIIFQEGSAQTIAASGAQSYEWYDEGNTRISSTDSVSLSEEGTYLLVASVGSCQITRTFTVSFRDNFAIPNVITANGDGINDLWVLPNTFSRKPDVTVIIYNENGEEILNQPDYQNNWPQSSTAFTKQNMIFYYRILNGGKTLNQGTITVIR